MNFITTLEKVFKENGNAENAITMSKYMKNNFSFFGIKTDERRRIFKTVWAENQNEIFGNSRENTLSLYLKNEHEPHYCALEILIKIEYNYQIDDIQLIETLIKQTLGGTMLMSLPNLF